MNQQAEKVDRAWAEIDLDALASNLQVIRDRAGPGARVMLVVKADAYGHGAVKIARHAARCGVAALGVGTSAEALELREGGARLPILVLGTVVEDEIVDCLRAGVHIAVHSTDRRASLQELAQRVGLHANVHLNVDTGMGRLGVMPSRALDILQEVRRSSHLTLAGLMTHISSSEGALDPCSLEQKRIFDDIVLRARQRGLLAGWCHLANSAALFTDLTGPYDAVRPGIAAYGALPAHLPGADQLRPVLSLRSQVVFLKDVPQGHSVGYDSTWHAPRATRIATLALGYADGLSSRLGDRGEVLMHGRRAPIVGRISMDYTTVDVGLVPNVRVGDTATLIGTDGGQRIRLEDVARATDSLPYEVACAVGGRVSRTYEGGEDLDLPRQAAGDRPLPIIRIHRPDREPDAWTPRGPAFSPVHIQRG